MYNYCSAADTLMENNEVLLKLLILKKNSLDDIMKGFSQMPTSFLLLQNSLGGSELVVLVNSKQNFLLKISSVKNNLLTACRRVLLVMAQT